MPVFKDFDSVGLRLFVGNVGMLVTAAFYIAWWTLVFWPKRAEAGASAPIPLLAAIAAGVVAIGFLSAGLHSAPGSGTVSMSIVVGAVALYFILLGITKMAFRREVTSELAIMLLWAALEVLVVVALRASGSFDALRAGIVLSLIAAASIAGLVCYVLYYRLDALAGFWIGMVPLIADAAVVALILLLQILA